jgi:L-amino acid N-acyltransferase
MPSAMARIHRPPLAVLSAALSTLRAQGPLVFAEKVATELGWHRLLLLAADLTKTPMARPAKVPIDIRFLHPSELALLLESQPELEPTFAESHLAQGHPCLVALHEGRVVGNAWVARDAIVADWVGVRRTLAQDEAFVFSVHTALAHRRQGINLALNAHLFAWLRAEGARRAFCLTLPWNRLALDAHRRSGYRVCGHLVSLGYRRFRRGLLLATAS